MHQLNAHHQVQVEELRRPRTVGSDAAHHRREMDDCVRPDLRELPLRNTGSREVTVLDSRRYHNRTAFLEHAHECTAQEARSACDPDPVTR